LDAPLVGAAGATAPSPPTGAAGAAALSIATLSFASDKGSGPQMEHNMAIHALRILSIFPSS
jgi:hypothetical protein